MSTSDHERLPPLALIWTEHAAGGRLTTEAKMMHRHAVADAALVMSSPIHMRERYPW